jgi:hypothetical protein
MKVPRLEGNRMYLAQLEECLTISFSNLAELFTRLEDAGSVAPGFSLLTSLQEHFHSTPCNRKVDPWMLESLFLDQASASLEP